MCAFLVSKNVPINSYNDRSNNNKSTNDSKYSTRVGTRIRGGGGGTACEQRFVIVPSSVCVVCASVAGVGTRSIRVGTQSIGVPIGLEIIIVDAIIVDGWIISGVVKVGGIVDVLHLTERWGWCG